MFIVIFRIAVLLLNLLQLLPLLPLPMAQELLMEPVEQQIIRLSGLNITDQLESIRKLRPSKLKSSKRYTLLSCGTRTKSAGWVGSKDQ